MGNKSTKKTWESPCRRTCRNVVGMNPEASKMKGVTEPRYATVVDFLKAEGVGKKEKREHAKWLRKWASSHDEQVRTYSAHCAARRARRGW